MTLRYVTSSNMAARMTMMHMLTVSRRVAAQIAFNLAAVLESSKPNSA